MRPRRRIGRKQLARERRERGRRDEHQLWADEPIEPDVVPTLAFVLEPSAGRASSSVGSARTSSDVRTFASRRPITSFVRILVAEDETIIRLDLRGLLERAGHKVVGEARDGEEAVGLARELEPPDLAVMDVKMPRLDGIEAAQADPRRAAVADRDADRLRPGRARRARGRGRRVRLPRQAVPRAGPAAGDPRRPARGTRSSIALREQADSLAEALARTQGDRAREGCRWRKEGPDEGMKRSRGCEAEPGPGTAAEVVAEALIATFSPS